MTGCTVRNNNTKGFDRGWEAGGDKICLTRGAILENSIFVDNRGNGIWFDIGNEDCEVRNCLIANNEDAGIFYEISYGLHAHDNVIVGNGFAFTPGAWGATAGISLSSSPGCTIERNLILGNKEGFNFREQSRSTPRIDNGNPSRSGTTIRSSATTSSPTIGMPRSGAGSTSRMNATGRSRCKRPRSPLSRQVYRWRI